MKCVPKKRRFGRGMIILVGGLLLLGGFLSPASADVVIQWNALMSSMIKDNNISNHHGTRAVAMMNIAMFDAINSITPKYEKFLIRLPVLNNVPESLAAAAAAYTVVSKIYPAKQDLFAGLFNTQLAEIENTEDKFLAIQYGAFIGETVLEWRQNDGASEANIDFPDGTGPGEWRNTSMMPPMLPGWGKVMPFTMTRNTQFRLLGPPPLDSYAYARDYYEVMEMGRKSSALRSELQTEIAKFWPGGIPRIWNLIAYRVSQEKGYNLLENARLFTLLNVGMADGNIAGWDMKYHYAFWRPVTAISDAGIDGNDLTNAEEGWESLLPSPPFPEYVSGHSISCAVAATILAHITGDDAFSFTVVSEANPSLPPHDFNSFWAAACEAGISRIYGGIHFNFSNVEGLEAGRSLGRYISENFMLPLPEGS